MQQTRRGLPWGRAATVALVAVVALVALVAVGALGALGSLNTEADAPSGDVSGEGIVDSERESTTASDETDSAEQPLGGETEGTEPPTPMGSTTAREMLGTIAVKGRAPKTGYDREGQFGPSWFDTDANGCDTRNDILQRDLDNVVSDDGCTVLSGELRDPFSSERIDFQRGETTSILVQVDHVVALSNAWQTGAAVWDDDTRLEFANDPLNLIAVSGRLNAQKGAGDAATWLPPEREFWCEYVARQVAVKAHYDLWVTPAEFERMDTILADCGDPPGLSPASHRMFRPGSIPGF
jgi:hypothetical protein